MSSWAVRTFSPGDETGIVALHNRVFRTQTDISAWRWKLRQHVDTYPNVWLAEADGEIIGHYAGIPTPVRFNDRVTTALQAVDAMVAPEFRRQGILLKLIESAHSDWQRAGYEFVYGLPVETWGSRVRTFSSDVFTTLDWHSRPLRPTALLASRLRVRLPEVPPLDRLWNVPWDAAKPPVGLEISRLESAGHEIDRLWQTLSPSLKNSFVRDTARLSHRYFAHPHFDYRVYLAHRGDDPAGYLVVRMADVPVGRVGYLVEWFTRPDDSDARKALIRFGVEIVRAEGAVSIHAIGGAGSDDASLLRKAGFLFKPGRYLLRFSPLSDRFSPGAPSDWTFQGGDFDVL